MHTAASPAVGPTTTSDLEAVALGPRDFSLATLAHAGAAVRRGPTSAAPASGALRGGLPREPASSRDLRAPVQPRRGGGPGGRG